MASFHTSNFLMFHKVLIFSFPFDFGFLYRSFISFSLLDPYTIPLPFFRLPPYPYILISYYSRYFFAASFFYSTLEPIYFSILFNKFSFVNSTTLIYFFMWTLFCNFSKRFIILFFFVQKKSGIHLQLHLKRNNTTPIKRNNKFV